MNLTGSRGQRTRDPADELAQPLCVDLLVILGNDLPGIKAMGSRARDDLNYQNYTRGLKDLTESVRIQS